jgi:hypothetical protein
MTGMWIARARKTKKKNIQYLYIKYIKKNHANIPSVSTRGKDEWPLPHSRVISCRPVEDAGE